MNPSNKLKSYIRLAKQKAWDSSFPRKHGAVLIKGGAVVNVSCNDSDYSRFADRFRNKKCYASRHAEIMCVLGMARELTEGSIIVVVRINNNGDLMYSKPCQMCFDLLKFVGIRRVFYTVGKGDNVECLKIR